MRATRRRLAVAVIALIAIGLVAPSCSKEDSMDEDEQKELLTGALEGAARSLAADPVVLEEAVCDPSDGDDRHRWEGAIATDVATADLDALLAEVGDAWTSAGFDVDREAVAVGAGVFGTKGDLSVSVVIGRPDGDGNSAVRLGGSTGCFADAES